MSEIRVVFEYFATIEVERYTSSAGVSGFRARVSESAEIAHAVQEIAPAAEEAVAAVASKLKAINHPDSDPGQGVANGR